MKITFTKGSGKVDRMTMEREDGTRHAMDCPKQRIIPHEMVHYVVESTLEKRGFLSRVKGGEAADARMQGNPESDGVERLVEVFQGDAWSGGTTSAGEMLDLYQVTCRARACTPLPVGTEDLSAIRSGIEQLDRQWQPLAVGAGVVGGPPRAAYIPGNPEQSSSFPRQRESILILRAHVKSTLDSRFRGNDA